MILLIGGEGSIGRRYQAVLRALGVEFKVYDRSPQKKDYGLSDLLFAQLVSKTKHAIIASPTSTHFDYCLTFERNGIPYLCEKPVSMDPKELTILKGFKAGYVVNNWSYIGTNAYLPLVPKSISYDFYNTGRDGLLFDVCQLIYLAKKTGAFLSVRRDSHFWDVTWDGQEVPYRFIEESYLQMVRAFLKDYTHMLWKIRDGVEMSEAVMHLQKKVEGRAIEDFTWNPSTDEFYTTAGENLSEDRTEKPFGVDLGGDL